MSVPRPRALKPGDTIHVVSPASPLSEELLWKGLRLFENQGYRIKLAPHVLDADDYLAGSDMARAADLMAAFNDPEAAAVLCSRGGYGCARLLPLLDLDRMAASGKMFIGFSDITTLHAALNKRGMVTVHSPMAITLSYDRVPWVHESVFNLLTGDPTVPADAPRATSVVPGVAEGLTVGGCLILLCDGLGTPEEVDTKGKILFLEDVDENPHRVDAMFTHMLNAGKLQEAAAVVVGEMTRTDERRDQGIGGKPWREIVSERLQKAGVPSVIDFPFGHCSTMLSVPFGVHARFDCGTGELTYLEKPFAD